MRTGEDVPDDDVSSLRGEGLSDRAGLAHPDADEGGPREVEPLADVVGELRIELNDDLPRLGVAGGEVAGHRASAAALVEDAQPQGPLGREAVLNERRDPPHVLEVEPQGVAQHDVGALHAVDLQEPAVGRVAVGHELCGARADRVEPGPRAHLPLARGRLVLGPSRAGRLPAALPTGHEWGPRVCAWLLR